MGVQGDGGAALHGAIGLQLLTARVTGARDWRRHAILEVTILPQADLPSYPSPLHVELPGLGHAGAAAAAPGGHAAPCGLATNGHCALLAFL